MLKMAQSASASLGRMDRICGWIFSGDGEVVLVMAFPAKAIGTARCTGLHLKIQPSLQPRMPIAR
jgi:hypothetical protein